MTMFSKLITRFKDLVVSDDGTIAGSPPKGEFVMGINFGGDAATIEGQRWQSYQSALAAGLEVPGAETIATAVQPEPYASPHIRQMLNSVIYRTDTLQIHQPLPNGTYHVYLWIMENFQTDWHSLEVNLNGQTVATGIGKLPLGHWQRYGAYSVTVTDGSLHLTISTGNPKIDAHVMGISIYK